MKGVISIEISSVSTDAVEDQANEEKTLLSQNEDVDASTPLAPPMERGMSWCKVKIFLCGFFSNTILAALAVTFWRASLFRESVGESATPFDGPVFMNDTASFKYLLDSKGSFRYSKDYFLLQRGFDAQINQAYCGVASVVTVLNSFKQAIHLPIDFEYDPYQYATQADVFDECVTRTVVIHDDEFDGILAAPFGLGMSQVEAMLACFFRPEEGWEVEAIHLDPSRISVDEMRNDIIPLLEKDSGRVLVNFERSVLHEEGGGHWSPLAAYNAEIDAFLVLDVAKYKYEPFWVSVRLLHEALATKDDCGKWNFPISQNHLAENLLYPANSKQYEKAKAQLACESSYRGYLKIQNDLR